MNYRSKFKQGKEYFVLDAESALLLQNGEDFQPKLQKVVFEEFSSMVILFRGNVAQYVTAARGMDYCDPMDFSNAVKVEDVVVFKDMEELKRISEFAKQDSVRVLHLFNVSENEGASLELPDTIGTESNGKIIVGFLVEEKKSGVTITNILMEKKEWEAFQVAANSDEDEFSVFNKFFLRR